MGTLAERRIERAPTHDSLRGGFALVGFVGLCFLASAMGSLLGGEAQTTWYETLVKPSYQPPDWVFAPVWTALYLCMAVAAWLVYRKDGWTSAHSWWVMQLVFNVMWSGIFFGLRNPVGAFVEIIALFLLVVVTTVLFWERSRGAGLLMLPYLAWVAFAAVINHGIWKLNA